MQRGVQEVLSGRFIELVGHEVEGPFFLRVARLLYRVEQRDRWVFLDDTWETERTFSYGGDVFAVLRSGGKFSVNSLSLKERGVQVENGDANEGVEEDVVRSDGLLACLGVLILFGLSNE
jgi:hypothetical protein